MEKKVFYLNEVEDFFILVMVFFLILLVFGLIIIGEYKYVDGGVIDNYFV